MEIDPTILEIRQCLKKAKADGISDRRLAALLGQNPRTIRNVRDGLHLPSGRVLSALRKGLCLDPVDLEGASR